jgi:enoyl-CoA hydratase
MALSGGTEMALACDMIVAARNATFGQTQVHYGVVPPEGGMVRLMGGYAKASRTS